SSPSGGWQRKESYCARSHPPPEKSLSNSALALIVEETSRIGRSFFHNPRKDSRARRVMRRRAHQSTGAQCFHPTPSFTHTQNRSFIDASREGDGQPHRHQVDANDHREFPPRDFS